MSAFRYRPHYMSDPPVDPERCAASVYPDDRSTWAHQCQNRRKYGEWCGVHDPERAAARAASRKPTRFEREQEQRRKQAEGVETLRARVTRLEEMLSRTLSVLRGSGHGYGPTYIEAMEALQENQ